MELWIRSQDKETLITATHLDIYGGNDCWTIEESGVDLGDYKSKERALEVLDEIQEILSPPKKSKCIISTNKDFSFIPFNTYVYEMPKE